MGKNQLKREGCCWPCKNRRQISFGVLGTTFEIWCFLSGWCFFSTSFLIWKKTQMPGDSSRDLFIPELEVTEPFKRVTFSPSQKGHQQNWQVSQYFSNFEGNWSQLMFEATTYCASEIFAKSSCLAYFYGSLDTTSHTCTRFLVGNQG